MSRAAEILAPILACPRCRTPMKLVEPSCATCGFTPRTLEPNVLDLVDESLLSAHDRDEIESQEHSVGAYYENEAKLSFHWDRLSADDLFDQLGLPPSRVLDLGCATGGAGSALRRRGHVVVGADLTTPCLVAAEARLDAVVRADAAHLPFVDEAFDGIVARGTLHHVEDPRPVLSEARRVLKTNGRALFVDPRAFWWMEPVKKMIRKRDPGFSDDHRAFSRDEYVSMIGGVFELESVRTVFPAAVLLAVATDLVDLPDAVPRRRSAEILLDLDRRLSRTPLARLGHLLIVRARKR